MCSLTRLPGDRPAKAAPAHYPLVAMKVQFHWSHGPLAPLPSVSSFHRLVDGLRLAGRGIGRRETSEVLRLRIAYSEPISHRLKRITNYRFEISESGWRKSVPVLV